MESDLLRIFQALEQSTAKYLVVGGVAVVLHGHLRVTADVDLVIKLEEQNLRKALGALNGLGFRPRAPVRLEQFADAESEPFDFDEAYARGVRAEIEGVGVMVVSIDDLIALKRAVGRGKDEQDVEALLELKRAKDG